MAITKFVKGRLLLDGVRLQNVNSFKPPVLKKEGLTIETIEGVLEGFNNYKFERPEGTFKLNGIADKKVLGAFLKGDAFVLRSSQIFQQYGALTQSANIVQQTGMTWDITCTLGGLDQDELTSGDGGSIEVPYVAQKIVLKDRDASEIISMNFITNDLKINGESVRTFQNTFFD